MNPRTTIGPKLLGSLILCLWIFSAAQRAEAGPLLLGSGYGETPDGLHVVLVHGPIAAIDVHLFAPNPPGAMFWDFSVAILESPRGADADFVQIVIGAQHIVGIHPGEGPNPNRLPPITIETGALAAGNNMFALPLIPVEHPPLPNHNDVFGGTVTFTVAMDGLTITGYMLDFFVLHCSPDCPEVPPINKELRDLPEGNALMLFGSGLAGLLGYGYRRKNVWLRQRKRS